MTGLEAIKEALSILAGAGVQVENNGYTFTLNECQVHIETNERSGTLKLNRKVFRKEFNPKKMASYLLTEWLPEAMKEKTVRDNEKKNWELANQIAEKLGAEKSVETFGGGSNIRYGASYYLLNKRLKLFSDENGLTLKISGLTEEDVNNLYLQFKDE